MKNVFLIVMLFVFSEIKSQIAITEIPDSLKKEATSVVQFENTNIVCKSKDAATEKKVRIVTILEEDAKSEGGFYCGCSAFADLKKFSGTVYRANGSEIFSLKKSDLIMSQYTSDALMTDYYYYYYHLPNNITYPCTVKYEWEVSYHDGLLSYSSFMPQETEKQSVLRAEYHLTLPEGVKCLCKAVNAEMPEIMEKGVNIVWQNMLAQQYEPFAPPSTAFPFVLMVPDCFQYEDTKGSNQSWLDWGKWSYGLYADRGYLPEKIRAKVKNAVALCSTDREKVVALYKLLGETTRYVSVQVGLGRLQPENAEEVARTGMGDCKGLSNLMHSMLAEVGIPSYFVLIRSGRTCRSIYEDYVRSNQFNHVILQVPFPDDTLWIECTASPYLPLGYVHSDIVGHQALVLTPQGGLVSQLPNRADSLNLDSYCLKIKLDETGDAFIEGVKMVRMDNFEDWIYFERLTFEKQQNKIRSLADLSQVSVQHFSFKKGKDIEPEIQIDFSMKCKEYGKQTGNHYVIPINAFRVGMSKLKKKKERKNNIYIASGYMDSDTLLYELAPNMEVETLPMPIVIDSDFGKYSSIVTKEGKNIRVIQTLLIKRGEYSADSYMQFIAFLDKISKTYTGKIELKKNGNTIE